MANAALATLKRSPYASDSRSTLVAIIAAMAVGLALVVFRNRDTSRGWNPRS